MKTSDEKMMKQIFAAEIDGYCRISTNGYLLDANPALSEMLGYSKDELCKMHLTDIDIKQSPQEVAETMEAVKTTGSAKFQTIQMTKDGRKLNILVSTKYCPAEDENDQDYFVAFFRDVTQEKILRNWLEKMSDKYQALYNSAPVALFRTSIPDGKFLEGNDKLAQLLGYEKKEQYVGKHHSTDYYEDPAQRDDFINQLHKDGHVDGFEFKTKKIHGSQRWFRISAKIYPNQDYIEGAIWDITAQKTLTSSQRAVLELLMQGKTNKQIASNLTRSIRTIEDHRAHIMHKFNAENIVDLTKKVMLQTTYNPIR